MMTDRFLRSRTVLCTTGGLLVLFFCAFLFKLIVTRELPVAPITINWNITRQTIDGFGATVTGYSDAFSAATADRFFDPQTGLGLSLLRIRVIPDTVPADCDCVSNSTPHQCVAGSDSQILAGDLKIAQEAAARGVTLFAAAWSPPAAMKSSGKYCAGGSLISRAANYATYAADLASFPALLGAYGVSIVALSIQNEPDINNDTYDTCIWTSQQIHDFIPYLSKALSTTGFGNIRIAIPEEGSWSFELMSKAMEDPVVASEVGLILGHAYRAERPTGMPSVDGRHVWQSEVSGMDAYNGSMKDAIMWAQYIHNYMSLGANAWMFWSLDCGPRYYNQNVNGCLTDQRGEFAKRAYVLGQYAKFIRPGWRRVDVTNRSSLLVTAYKGPQKEFAIVAVNKSRFRAVRDQQFVLDGARSLRSQVTPWLTSTSASLAPQPAVSLTSDGSIITYTIPANAVVTLQGHGD